LQKGEFTACCRYGEDCTASCLTGGSNADIVAGCEIDPNKAPVEMPTAEPSDSPTPAPLTCPVTQNTDNCDQLVQNQSPIEDCDCYNYCGNSFSNCCSADDPTSCGGNCQNLPLGAVLTVGCLLPECGQIFSTCDSNDDCCSGRCVFSLCRSPLSTGKQAVKLSGTRGGAGGRAKASGSRAVRQLLTKEKKKMKIRGR
jgi:hypothetical protein